MKRRIVRPTTAVPDDPVLHVQFIRPAAGSRITPGRRLAVIGWLDCSVPVLSAAVYLGARQLCTVQVGLSLDEIQRLANQPVEPANLGVPSKVSSGFVFSLTVPQDHDEGATLGLITTTAQATLRNEIPLVLRGGMVPDAGKAMGKPEPEPHSERPEPVRLLIERAEVSAAGILEVSGWAVGVVPIQQIAIFAGDRPLGVAQLGIVRPDVAEQHGAFPNADKAGFLLRRELTDEEAAKTMVHIAVTSGTGPLHRYQRPLLAPAKVVRAAASAEIALQCDELVISEKGIIAVKGWAVCSTGVSGILLEVDEAELGTAVPAESRPDVANSFPRIRGADIAGFRLLRTIGQPMTGDHVVKLTVLGSGGERKSTVQRVAVQPEVPAHFATQLQVPLDAASTVEASDEESPIHFYLDAPAVTNGVADEPVSGFMSVAGWTFGRTKIDGIEVFVDGVSQGGAYYGIRREDLQNAFPKHDALLAGFAMVIPPQVMKPGQHQVRLVVRSVGGDRYEASFSVHATKAEAGAGPWQLRTGIPLSEIRLAQAVISARGAIPKWLLLISAPRYSATADVALATTLDSLRQERYTDWSAAILVDDGDIPAYSDCVAKQGWLVGRAAVLSASSPVPLADLAGNASFVVYLRPGDRIGENALLEMGVAAALQSGADFLYCDERRFDPADRDLKAFFKPDWSPELLQSTNYVGHFWAASTGLLHVVGIVVSELATHGNYDAILRLTERAAAVAHVPKVLCERGRFADEPATERKALMRSLRRQGQRGAVMPWVVPGSYRIKRSVTKMGLVSIIIPTNASKGYIETAITSIRQRTNWPSYEIICIDNIPLEGTSEQRSWKNWIASNADRVVATRSAFNWSRFNNRGVRAAQGQYLLFLNDDVEILDADWLHNLVEQAQRPEIGVVGPQLLYPDRRVQHAGMFLARRGARHAFRFYPSEEPGPFGLARTQRDVISVTGACMMMRREVFDAVGGFDERHAVVNNDLDFNLRVRKAGLAVIYTPWVSLIHHEMVSRSKMADIYNSRAFEHDWGDQFLKGDPFHSPFLSTEYDDYLPDTEVVKHFTVGHPLVDRESVRRILVIKLDHIGDFITAFPAFRRLKEKFPRAELVVLAAKASLSLVALEPAIDRVIEFNFFYARSEKGRRTVSSKDLVELRRRLEPETFDLAIDLRRQPDTRAVLQYTGARWLAGFDRGYAHPWLDFAVEFEGDLARHYKREHVVDSLVHLVDAVSANCEPVRSVMPKPRQQTDARAAIGGLLKDIGYVNGRAASPLVCIHTGAGAVNKQWPRDSFAGLIDLLVGELNAFVVIIGGPDEMDFALAVLKRVRRREGVVNIVGRTKLKDLPDVLTAADLYVGNDSGPKHLAAALGVPTVGIHSGSVDAGEWGPMGDNSITVARSMTCSPCYLAFASDCHRGLACLTGISVGSVYRASQLLLELVQTRRS